MKKKYITLLLTLLLISACSKTEDETISKTVATIGNSKITVDEFQTRFEFTPRIQRFDSPEGYKKHFIASLIAEKLLFEVGQKLELDTTFQIVLMIKQREKEAVVEALFNNEVADKIRISETEIKEAYFRSKQELFLKYIVIDDLNEATRASKLLKNGQPFDSIASSFIPFGAPLPTKRLKWGDAVPAIEDAVFKLKQAETTEPIKVDNQFYILCLENKKSDVFLTENDYLQNRSSLKKKILSRKRSQMFSEYLTNILNETRVTVPGKVFDFVVTELENALEIGGSGNQDAKLNATRFMFHSDYLKAASRLEENLDQPFTKFNDGTFWTIREFLTKLWLGPYPLNYGSKKNFRASLRHTIRFMIELEQLAQQGYHQNLHKTDYVREESRIWRDYFVAAAAWHAILDTLEIAEEKCLEYYEKHKTKYLAPKAIKNKLRTPLPFEKVKKAVREDALREIQRETMERYLQNFLKQYTVTINTEMLDSLKIIDTIGSGMLVLKQHFPGRMIAPPVQPTDNLVKWQADVNKLFSRNRR